MWSRRTFLAIGASVVGSRVLPAQIATKDPVVLGQVSLSFYAVTGAVVYEVLTRLGHAVEVCQGPHEQMFPLLGQGAIDVMAAAWLPEGHASYWTRYGTNAIEVAALYDGAHFFLGVPDYVPADQVSSIADLAQPAVAERMTKVIQGIGPGAAITVRTEEAVARYGLDTLGYSLRAGTPEEWTDALDRAVAEERWIVFPTWTPQFLNRGGTIRPLKDPLGVLGGMNHASLVAPRARFSALPPRTQAVLSRIALGLDGVTEMDWMVNVQKQSPREAAQAWMGTHEALVSEWFRSDQ